MPIECYRHGFGITEKERIRVTRPFDGPEQTALGKILCRDGLYGANLEAQMRGILEAAGITTDHEKFPDGGEASGWAAVVRKRGYKDDSEQDFAARLLDMLGLIRASINLDQAEQAVRFAIALGATAKEAEMKFRWESYALRGQRWAENQKQRAEQLQQSNAERAEVAVALTAGWQTEADAVWSRNPHLSTKSVAELVAKKLGGEANTIRRKIRRSVK